MNFLEVQTMVFQALGGLGLFMLGMHFLSDGIQILAAARMRTIMERLARNRVLGLLSGAFVTAVVQSSTLVTVMIVGFVSSSIITLEQAIALIMGANIGTTVTTIIISLPITKYGLPFAGVAALIYVSSHHEKIRYGALTAIGLGLIFFGLDLIISGFQPIRTLPEVVSFIATFDAGSLFGIIKCVFMGAVLTAIIHSSSAMNGIVMGMAASGILGWQTSLAVVLGSEIGTTVTSLLAASTLSINAKRTSYAHLGFNLIGATMAIAAFPLLSTLVAFLVGGNPGKPMVVAGMTSYPLAPVAIATFVTSFNILSTCILLPFVPQGARLLNRIGENKTEADDLSVPKYLFMKALDEPQMALTLFEKEQNRFLLGLTGLLDTICRPGNGTQAPTKLLSALESLHREIIDFGERLCSRELESETASQVINLVQLQETSSVLMQRLCAISVLFQQQGPENAAMQKAAAWIEALDALLGETAEAMERGDVGQLKLLKEMTSDRAPGLEAIRQRYLEDGEHFSIKDRQFLVKILGHFEGCIWMLNILAQAGMHSTGRDAADRT
ncbi:MAG: Na/Pi cotransporter family protein [Chlorobiaceae bacterium]|nr:Na/Pi cotransporter family protein [Chlorobiaceae bacterium]